MRKVLIALAFVGVLALAGVPAAAYADGCHDNCDCVAAPTGATNGCLAPAGDDAVSVCGDAAVPAGCVCVGGECVNNVDLATSMDPASIQGCPASVGPLCN